MFDKSADAHIPLEHYNASMWPLRDSQGDEVAILGYQDTTQLGSKSQLLHIRNSAASTPCLLSRENVYSTELQ